jgi:hypothetical protein
MIIDTKQFLSTVLSDEGYYHVAGIAKNKPIKEKFYTSLDEAIETANNFDEEGRDSYFALGLFLDANKGRTAQNVRGIKSLFLDLDCGEGKPYSTQQDALIVLKAWYKKYGIPRPTVVNSGRGLHVYWALDRAYTREEWLPTAKALKAACLQDGLHIDAVVTADAARLLRVPNTRNFKDVPPKDTKVIVLGKPVVLEEFAAKLPTHLIPGCPNNGKIKSPITLCRELKLAESDEVEVRVYDEPEEFYDERAEEVAIAPSVSAPSNADGGDIPPSKPKKESVLEKIKIPGYPPGYARPEGGGVAKISHDKDGNREEKVLCPDNLYVKKRMVDVDGPCYEIGHTSDFEGERTFVASQKELMSTETFRGVMNSNDVLVMPSTQKDLMEYIAAWITKLKPEGPPIQVKSQFGWTEGLKSFVIGDKEIFANRVENSPAGSRTAQYMHMFKKKGTLEKWKELAQFYGQEGFEQHQYMFGLSFGSPLMEFISGISGCIYNLNSPETGVGKTTGMWGGASVWGSHKKLVLIGKDTPNSAWNRAEVIKNLPLYIDEVSNYKPQPASDFCYAISDGVQKNRMSGKGENAERYRGEPWALNCGTSGNSSLTEVAGEYRSSPKGETGRVVSHSATKLLRGASDTLRANDLNDQLDENYGHAGPLFIQHILKNKAAAKKLTLDTRSDIVKEIDGEPQERFWIAQGATVYAGCTIAKQIGLIDWDLDNLWDWIIAKIKEQRAGLTQMDMDIHDIISQFYMDNVRSILRITSTADARDPELQNIIRPDMQDMPNFKFVARHETDIGKLFIRGPALKSWINEHKYTESAVKALIFSQMDGRYGKKRMGKGTKMDIGTTHVIECTFNNDLIEMPELADEVKAK